VGDTLAVGTNLALSDNVVEQIYSLNQGLTNSLANISHENLLDNPWFTVNQRGQSSYSVANQYSYDRWLVYGSLSVSKNNEIITLSNTDITKYSIVSQKLENSLIDNLRGRTVTLSILLSDNSIVKGSTIIPTSNPSGADSLLTVNITSDSKHSLIIFYTGSIWEMRVQIRSNYATGQENLLFKAVKLELGSVSTLAMDTAPNYQQELAKCQRYFVRLHNESIGTGIIDTANNCACVVPVLVPMRATPSLTLNGVIGVGVDDGTFGSLTSITSWDDRGITCVGFSGSGITHVAGSSLRLFLINDNSLDISADL
jgi:hypothetical protein